MTWGGENGVWWHPLLGLGAGFLGGMLGLGGGIIMSPVLVEFGMHPEAVQATTATFVFLSSSLAVVQFSILGAYMWDYCLWYCALATVATLLGQLACEFYVRKHKRYSIITLSI